MGATPEDTHKRERAASQTAQSASGPEDERVQQLERKLTTERQGAFTLRQALDSASFKATILEKSYAKQLSDARDRQTELEEALSNERSKVVALETEVADLTAKLKLAEADLARAKASRASASATPMSTRTPTAKSHAPGPGLWRRPPLSAASIVRARPAPVTDEDYIDSASTINEIVKDQTWAGAGFVRPSGPKNEHVGSAHEPEGDMLAPDLVFSKDKDEKP